MTHLIQTISEAVCWLTLSRPEKNNAFDDILIHDLTLALKEAISNEQVRVIVLKSEGKHFSAGADLKWMQRMAEASQTENEKDALLLAELLYTLYHCPKPTIAQVQGAAYGGGVGLIAACDIVIAAQEAQFCFSEVKLGLIPAVISPYVVQAIGPRIAKRLFMTGEVFSTDQALRWQLIHELVEPAALETAVYACAKQLTQGPQLAVQACKSLVELVTSHPLDQVLMKQTAERIAEQRQSKEAKHLIQAFLDAKSASPK